MKGAFFVGADKARKFEIREMTFPEKIGENDVLIRVKSCGVCGTDVHIYHGEEGSAPVNPPVVLGHEFSGIVVRTGSSVTSFAEGDHVCVDPNIYCGACRPCQLGKKQNCRHLYALGVNTNGGFAEYCICPATNVFHINDDTDFDEAAMVEPLACAIHGIDRVNLAMGQNVLIIGGGPIGLIMVQLARLKGAARVILSEPVKQRRDIGLQVGADAVIDPVHEDLKQRILEITGIEGVDAVIECVGKPIAAKQAIEAAGFGASVLLFSVPAPGSTIELSLMDIYKKELIVMGSIINPDTHLQAVELINSKRIEIKKLITHKYGIDNLYEAIKKQMSGDSIKVIVNP